MGLLDQPGALIALAGVLILLLLMWSMARRVAPKPAPPTAAMAAPESLHESLILRFVTDEQGERLGETVSLDGDRVILKVKDGFVSVPASKIKDQGGNLQLDFGVDWDEARRLGEEWRARSHKVIEYSESELPKDEP